MHTIVFYTPDKISKYKQINNSLIGLHILVEQCIRNDNSISTMNHWFTLVSFKNVCCAILKNTFCKCKAKNNYN